MRLAIVAILALGLWTATPAHAAPACADLFRRATVVERATAPIARVAKRAVESRNAKPIVIPATRIAGELSSLVERLRAPRFQIERFDFALEYYRNHGIEDVPRPTSRESRLAYLHYVTSKDGRNPYDLEAMAHAASPAEFKALVKSIGRFNTDKGFSPSQIDAIYWKLFTFSASTPNALRNISRIAIQNRGRGVFEKVDRIALEQWTTKELASHSAVEAFENLGLIRDQGTRGRMMDLIRSHPNVTANLVTGGLMIIEKHLMGSPVSAPTYSKLRVTQLSAELRSLVEEKGFDAAYPLLKEKYGHLARFDRGYYFARRAVTVGLMTYMLAHLVPTLVQGVIPPHLVTSEMNAVQITEAVVRYYSDLSQAMVNDRVYGTGDRELTVRAGNIEVKVHKEIAPPNTVKTPEKINLERVSQGRVEITFDQQLALEKKPKGPPAKVPTSDLGSTEQTAKAIDDNLDYLNSLDFSDPKNL